MSYSFRVAVTAGPYSWEFTDETEIEEGYTGLVSPFTVTRSIPEGDLWPAQPAPAVASFAVVADEYADLADLAEDVPVYIAYYSPSTAEDPLEQFAGRISDLVISPHKVGVIANVTCTDYLADLAEYQVTVGGFPVSTMTAMISGLWDAAGLTTDPPAPVSPFGAPPTNPTVVIDTATGSLATQLENYLGSWIVDWADPPFFPYGPLRFVLAQNADEDGLDAFAPFKLIPMWRYLPTTAWSGVLDLEAGVVDVAGAFTLRKGDRLDVVETTYVDVSDASTQSVTASRGGSGVPRATRNTRLTDEDDAQTVSDFYLPGRGSSDDWVADAFTWRLYASEEGSYVPVAYGGGPLGILVNIDGIDDRWCPTGTTYTGLLAAYTLTIIRNRPTISLLLRPKFYEEP